MSDHGDVAAVIDDMVARGVFRAAPQLGAGSTASGVRKAAPPVLRWRITWFSGHEMQLHAQAHEVRIDDVLPSLPAQSQIYRELRVWLKAQQSTDLPPHRRLDPAQISLAVRNSGGQIRLTLGSETLPLPTVAQRAVQLVHALYLDFLNGPGRLEWVTEAFGLDPDNPRFS